MTMIDSLQAVSVDASKLQGYLTENFQEVHDFFNNEKYSILLAERDKIEKYILFKIQLFRQLDINNKINLSFITLLLDISERFGFLNAFQLLYDVLRNNAFDFGKRLEAAVGYLVGINTKDDYLKRFDYIYSNLQLAFETEEDTESKVLATIINYYAQVIYNFEFNPQVANDLKEKIIQRRSTELHSFLQHPLMAAVLNIPITPHDTAFEQIHQLLDSFLGRDIIRLFSTDLFLIEDKTQYSFFIAKNAADFNSIRDINNRLYQPVKSDDIFHSLQRGVKILKDENQLFAYMYSYGKMHYAKLLSCFEYLPTNFIKKTIRIVDWGCGQGMATMSYLDHLKVSGVAQDIRHITLIEPSEIALKRATLHANKYTGGNNILTINKDLDSLVLQDFSNSIPTTKLHFFSNILDIDLFSLSNLLEIIVKRYAGENYFVCVSPYVNGVKTSRIDSFVHYFSKKNEFELLGSVDSKYGEWENGWTRVIRVFKVKI